MPLYKLNNKKKCISLQEQKPKIKKTKIRALLYTSLKGSLTMEASLILPLFLLVISGIIYFLIIMNTQMGIQTRLENIARDISKTAYITEDIKVFNYIYAKACLMDSDFKKEVDKSNIIGGHGGINLYESCFFDQEGILDLVVTYKMSIAFIPEKIFTFPCSQRARVRTWIGKDISGDDMEGSELVYITPTGTVYHTTRDCSHLKLSIRESKYKEIAALRNNQGGKYYPCSICAEDMLSLNDIVYITSEGDRWHSSIKCSGLKRTVKEISIKDVGDRPACSRCGGG